MGVTMTDGPHYYNGAKFTVRMDVGYEVVSSEGNYKASSLDIKIKYDKTAEELKALADQGDVSWSPVEGIQGWEDGQIRLFKMVQENLVNFYEEADGLNSGSVRELVSMIMEEYSDEGLILYVARYDKSTDELVISANGDEDTAHMMNEEAVNSHIIITKESFKKEQ